jgi:hypothetical protein
MADHSQVAKLDLSVRNSKLLRHRPPMPFSEDHYTSSLGWLAAASAAAF